jgi:hypothetical protein
MTINYHIIVNTELEKKWMEVMAYVKILSQQLQGATDENLEKPQDIRFPGSDLETQHLRHASQKRLPVESTCPV